MGTKDISTLVKDIEDVLLNGAEFTEPQSNQFSTNLLRVLKDSLSKTQQEFTLRMSNIGHPCVRKLWLDKWKSSGKEPLRASTKFKFLIGHLLEELILFLADLAGHDVRDQQKERDLYGIKGHSDTTLDGRLVDAKSASTYSFKKFKSGLTKETDAFGYLGQLGGYHKTAQSDDAVTDKDRASFLVIDKQHGHITLDTHTFDHENIDWEKAVAERVATVENSDVMPPRGFDPIEDGYIKPDTKQFQPNGSRKLPVNCSYCDQKWNCHDNLRVLMGSRGPVFFTELKHKFKMKELSKEEYFNPSIEEEVLDTEN